MTASKSLSPGSVWLDARGTQSEAHGDRGIGRYIAEHIRALLERDPGLIAGIGLEAGQDVPATLERVPKPELLMLQNEPAPPIPRPAIYHVMSPFEVKLELDELWPPWARGTKHRLVVTLYDLIPLVFRERYLDQWGEWTEVWMKRLELIRSAHQVLTISRNTADDAKQLLGISEERITVIDSGVSDEISSLVGDREADDVLRRELRGVRPGFLLYVGGDDPRKNMEGTIRAYGELPPELRRTHQLVIVCRLGHRRRFHFMRLARRLGIRRRELVLTGFISDRALAALYRRCALFIFPSLYEGAGLPILEAMTCGAPVAASKTSSIPELLGDDRATFDPHDPTEIAAQVASVLRTPGMLDALRERSTQRVGLFTWEHVAERTIDGYRRALSV